MTTSDSLRRSRQPEEATSYTEFCQRPDLFSTTDTEENVTVQVLDGGAGIYDGPDTPLAEVRALAGPIYQFGKTLYRLVCVNPDQKAGAYEGQWLQAEFKIDIQEWVVDHPNC